MLPDERDRSEEVFGIEMSLLESIKSVDTTNILDDHQETRSCVAYA